MVTQQCRMCSSRDLTDIVDLGLHPLADTFINRQQLADRQSYYPLGLVLCNNCGYVMSTYTVSAEERYQENEYSYDSSNSSVATKHFSELAHQIVERVQLGPSDLAVDIGSNVGTLLGALTKESGCSVRGVEPSANMQQIAEKNGVPTIPDFFNEVTVVEILKSSKAKVISATNVFNHIEDISALMKNVYDLLSDDGQFVIEVPYLVHLLEKDAFDTIYLEHVSYFSVRPHAEFFRKMGLYIYHMERNDYMGGSIRVFVGKHENKENTDLLKEFIATEEAMGLTDLATYVTFMDKVREFKYNLCSKLYAIKADGGNIIAIGAATKGNTLLNYCKIDATVIDYVAETSQLKIGKYTPGSRIPIIDEKEIDTNAKHVLILPWNIGDFLKSKLTHLTKADFIVPHM